MARFALRHWTAILIVLVVAGWAVFYLPDTPSFTVFRLKQAIDNQDGESAATYVDFQKVVRNAGYEWLQNKKSNESGGGDSGDSGDDSSSPLGQLIGKGAVDFLSGPMAALLRRWAVQQVDNGDKRLQMPPAAVVGAIVMLHRYGETAYTRWQDKKGQVYEVRMAREDGIWKIVEVKNVQELLNKLKPPEDKNFEAPPEASPVPPPA
jgi:Protein of unknown function (DUF2939)